MCCNKMEIVCRSKANRTMPAIVLLCQPYMSPPSLSLSLSLSPSVSLSIVIPCYSSVVCFLLILLSLSHSLFLSLSLSLSLLHTIPRYLFFFVFRFLSLAFVNSTFSYVFIQHTPQISVTLVHGNPYLQSCICIFKVAIKTQQVSFAR